MPSRGRQNITGKFYKGDEDFLCFSCGRQAGKKMCSLSLPSFNSQLYKIHDSNSIKICFGRAPMLYRIYSRSWRGIEVIWGPYYPPIHGHGFNRTRQLVVVVLHTVFLSHRNGVLELVPLAAWPLGPEARKHLPQRFCTEFAGPGRAEGRKETEHTLHQMDKENELAHRPHHKQTSRPPAMLKPTSPCWPLKSSESKGREGRAVYSR